MATNILMPALSPTMTEGKLAKWLVKEGDAVKSGDLIAEIETDKATMEMESFFEGTVLKVLVSTGDNVPVGSPMAVIGEPGEDADAAIAALGGAPAAAVEEAPAPSTPTPAPVTAASAPADGARVKASPLARRIFAVDGVEGVFLGPDFITVTKAESRDWAHLKPGVLGAILEHYQSGDHAVEGADASVGHAEHDGPDGEIVGQIKELLDTRVRPAVAQDGGDITFHGFEKGVVYLTMQGACAGCASSTLTLKIGIENLLRHYIPEVTEVRPIAG